MKRAKVLLLLSAAFFVVSMGAISRAAHAQQACVCTAGCKFTADAFAPGTDQPSTCAVYKAGVQIGSGPVVAASTIPLSNATICMPPDVPYNPGVAGSVACLVTIPAQPAGVVTLTMTASGLAGESVPSAAYTFQSVAALPTVPRAPTHPRAN